MQIKHGACKKHHLFSVLESPQASILTDSDEEHKETGALVFDAYLFQEKKPSIVLVFCVSFSITLLKQHALAKDNLTFQRLLRVSRALVNHFLFVCDMISIFDGFFRHVLVCIFVTLTNTYQHHCHCYYYYYACMYVKNKIIMNSIRNNQ